jgi:hypothetical protein
MEEGGGNFLNTKGLGILANTFLEKCASYNDTRIL